MLCAMCAVTSAFAKPSVREVEDSQLVPDTAIVSQQVVVSEPRAEPSTPQFDASVRRMLRFGFSFREMHELPASRIGLRYGLPVDEQATRDDRVMLNESFAVGTLAALQRDFAAYRDFGGQKFFRDDAVAGLKYFPVRGLDLHLGAGLLVSVDQHDPSSAVFGRPYLAISQVGFRF